MTPKYLLSPWRGLLIICLGTSLGVLNSACNHGFGPAYAAKLIGNSWGWMVPGLATCLAGHTWKRAFIRGIAFFVPAVLGYYISDSLAGVYTGRDITNPDGPPRFFLGDVLMDSFFYLIMTSITAAGLAVLAAWYHSSGKSRFLSLTIVPAYIAWDAHYTASFLRQDPWPSRDPELLRVVDILWPASLMVTVAVLMAGLWGQLDGYLPHFSHLKHPTGQEDNEPTARRPT